MVGLARACEPDRERDHTPPGDEEGLDDAMGSTDETRAAHQFADAIGYLKADPALVAEAIRIAKVLNALSP